MKKVAILMSLFILIGLTSCHKSVKDKVTAKWQLTEIDGEKAPADAEKVYMEFKSDGSVVSSSGDEENTGKWEMVDDQHIQIISEDDNNETLVILELTDNLLKVKDDQGTVVVMEK